MPYARIRILFLSGAIACATLGLAAQSPAAAQNSAGNATAGKALFQGHCSACHGIDGRGGEAPNIATNPEVQAFSDAQIEKIVTGGLPGGMPAFGAQLGASQIRDIVAYLRVLQGHASSAGAAAAPVGNAAAGRALFFGSADCSTCHMVGGKGGFIGPDLSGVPLDANGIRQAIVQPRSGPGSSWVTAHLKDGQTVTGAARNEDNFSIQLQDRSGAFHLLNKANIRQISRSSQPIMPSDYGTRLTATQLDDLVAFVAQQAGTPRRHRGADD